MIYLKTAAAVIAVLGLIWFGFTINGWRNDAARAKDLAVLLRNETQRRVASDAHRLAVEKSLAQAEENTHETIRTVVKKIIVKVPDDSRCDLNVDVVRMLDAARVNVPGTASEAPDTATEPAPIAPDDNH